MPQAGIRVVRGSGVAAFLLCAIILASERIAEACSCLPAQCGSAAGYDAVFEATVVNIEGPAPRADGMMSSADPVTVRLREVRALRGYAQAQVVTAASSVSCGYEFRVGRRYLIFASRRAEDGQLAVGACGLTRPLEGQAGMVRYVESLSAPSRGGRVFGRVAIPQMDYRAPFEPVPGARIVLEGATRAETRSDAAGAFEFVDLPPGDYRLVPEMPGDRPELSSEPLTAVLNVAHACADLLFVPQRSSHVKGTAVDAEGRPMANVFVRMGAADPLERMNRGGWGYTTGPDGAFVFPNVPPGQYVVGVSLTTGPAPMSPFPPTMARTAEGATVIDVARGAQVTLKPMTLSRQSQAAITGRVVTVNGTPVPGISVTASVLAEDGRQLPANPVRTDTDGGFRLSAYTGVRYRLLVGSPQAPEAAVDAVASSEPVTITLPRD